MFGCTSSSSETSLFKAAAVVVEGWSDALQKDHCKHLSGDGKYGYAAMVIGCQYKLSVYISLFTIQLSPLFAVYIYIYM